MKTHQSIRRPYVAIPLAPLGSDAPAIAKDFQRYLSYHLGRFQGCPPVYLYQALAYTLRDRLMVDWRKTWGEYMQAGKRRAYYMSLEFLIGRSLSNNLLNMNLEAPVKQALLDYCTNLEEVVDEEPDAGLGNGGLGRLAACFMDSCASLRLPVVGYGIRYEYGMFRQHMENGYQVEDPDHWLRDGNPWEVERAEYTQRVQFGGYTESYLDHAGNRRVRWVSCDDVLAIPFDMPISGYQNNSVNTLRLWKASATDEFNLDEFNAGSYTEAVEAKNHAEHISMVLYPNDSSENGKELRLRQQYFLASASLKDAMRMWERQGEVDYAHFAAENVFQMNDTHPTIAVAELMRILMDDKHLGWDEAWAITSHCMAYTNHTLLPEALERWPVSLFEKLLPRLLEIIYEINARFLREVSMKWPGDTDRQRRMSIIEEGHVKQVRMAFLAIVGSFSVNGVAALHSKLLVEGLFHDFYELWPQKFNNKTNGVTPRRWVAHANPLMTELISSKIGTAWIADLAQLEQLKPYAGSEYTAFHQQWREVKFANKQRLAALVKQECGVDFNPNALFDMQVKRLHEYKRQHLNLLQIIARYQQLRAQPNLDVPARVYLFAAKAAPGYHLAKNIILAINKVAERINNDPFVNDKLKVVFLPDYRVSLAELLIPAADVSEQISTAGKEASGTGNMKLAMNGAITVGTLDGANVEISEQVGTDNLFIFGHTVEQVKALLAAGYNPHDYYRQDPRLKAALDELMSGYYTPDEPQALQPLWHSLLEGGDPYLVLADFDAYWYAQQQVDALYQQPEEWLRRCILNTARTGMFSADRSIRDYQQQIWQPQA